MITKYLPLITVVALLATGIGVSCKKEDVDGFDPYAVNSVYVEFDNRVGDQRMMLGKTLYKNGSGETFSVTAFNYFVSNITLKNENGTVIKFPDQYFLVRQADTLTQIIELEDVPAGNYGEVSFIIGVDSLKTVGAPENRIGVLDPTSYGDDSMYWSSNLGYIFLKLEGNSASVPTTADIDHKFALHVGGYGGGWNGTAKTANNLRRVSLPITDKAMVRDDIAPELHLSVNALKIFDGPTKISLATMNSVQSPALATPIAENYKTMFKFDHVHN